MTADAVDPILTVHQALKSFAERVPNYHVAAGAHLFTCRGAECVTYLALTGLDFAHAGDFHPDSGPDFDFVPVTEWVTLRDEPCAGLGGLGPSEDQIDRIMQLAEEWL